jgi:predicted Zn-dependent protease
MSKLNLVEVMIRAGRWRAARKAIRAELKHAPEHHWLLTRLGGTYYEEGRYLTALRYAERARRRAPKCPLVLWDYAGTLQMLGRHRKAVSVYTQLIRRGPRRIANGECGEGLARARGLVADCHLRVSHSLQAIGRRRKALSEFEAHLEMRGPGCRSIYPLGSVNLSEAKTRNARSTV